MPADLTQNEFSKHLNTMFCVKPDLPMLADKKVELELVSVKGHVHKPIEQLGMERFTLYFQGPANVHLAQHVYPLEHASMGEFEIFLVPVGLNERGFEYEAVFNYFKSGDSGE